MLNHQARSSLICCWGELDDIDRLPETRGSSTETEAISFRSNHEGQVSLEMTCGPVGLKTAELEVTPDREEIHYPSEFVDPRTGWEHSRRYGVDQHAQVGDLLTGNQLWLLPVHDNGEPLAERK